MRTQPAHGPRSARGLRAGALVALAAFLVPAAPAFAQADGSSSGGDGTPSSALLLGGAALLLLAAALIGYGVPALRRSRARRGTHPTAVPAAASALGAAYPELSGPRAAQPAERDRRTPLFTQVGPPSPEPGNTGGVPATAIPPVTSFEPSGAPWGRATSGQPLARRTPPTPSGRERALGYTTFPERKRAVSPESRYQARRIRAACEVRGMVLHQLVGDVQSYAGPDLERPGLNHALELLGAGEASCLVVAGLDRLSRSAGNLGTVIEWLDELDARLVVIDIDLDTATEEGRVAARALVRVGALERRGGRGLDLGPGSEQRSRSGGRRAAVSDRPLLQRRIATMRASGMTLQAIADTLNKEGVPTLRGGAKWRPSSVQAATGYKRPGREAPEPAPADHEGDR
jgi:hypothetical protein